jgi:hypothetical protein
MKKITLVLLSSTLLFSCFSFGLDTNTKVVGHSSFAKRMCKDIIIDDSVKLDKDLKAYRRSGSLLSTYYRFKSSKLHRDFTCNHMELLEFAQHIGSAKTAEYLWQRENKGYNVRMEELTASRD